MNNRLLRGLVGAVLGFLLIRAFLLDGIEEVAFSLFMRGLIDGSGTFPVEAVLESSTFWKVTLGVLAGAAVGELSVPLQRAVLKPPSADNHDHS